VEELIILLYDCERRRLDKHLFELCMLKSEDCRWRCALLLRPFEKDLGDFRVVTYGSWRWTAQDAWMDFQRVIDVAMTEKARLA
jgi:hypothetical protein